MIGELRALTEGADHGWLAASGETGRLIAGRDWSATALGPLDGWPPALRTALGLVLRSPVPMVLLWGAEGVMLYNDAYSGLAGGRHPALLGSPVREGWPEVADFNDRVMRAVLGGGALSYKDMELTLHRHGRPEPAWMNLDYSPVLDGDGRPAGVLAVVIDATDRVRADRALAAERERLLTLFEQAPGLIASLRGPDHVVEFVNAAHRRVFGSAGWVGRPLRDSFGDLDATGLIARLDAVLATGERHAVEALPLRFRRPDGEEGTRYFNLVFEPVRDARGAIVGLLCEGGDVTDAHRAAEDLRRSEERLRAALGIETVGVVFLDLDSGRLLDANDAFLRQSGHARAALDSGALTWQGVTAPEWRDVTARALAELRATGLCPPYEKECLRADGSRWWALFSAKRLPDGTAFEVILDLTDRKRAEAALLDETRSLETLNRAAVAVAGELELGPLLQVITDAAVGITGARFGAYFHGELDEGGERLHLFTLSGARVEDFAPLGRPRATGVFGPTFRNEGVVRSDDILADARYGRLGPHHGMPRGHLPVRSYLAAPVVSRGGEVLGGLLLGHPEPARFTERHERLLLGLAAQAAVGIDNARLFQAVQAANETLESRVAERTAELTEVHEALRQAQKMEAVGQLTGGLAHDFNNLLAGIVGSLEAIERRLAQGRTADLGRFLDAASSSAQRAAALTQRLLAFARRQTLDPRPTDVNRLVRGMEDLIRRSVGPGIAVEVTGDPDLWPARVDAAQLESALLNLAINARDAMPDGGRLTIATANAPLDARAARDLGLPPGDYLRIVVADTGAGMPPEVIDRIFDPFFTTKPLGQGTGLGLSMVHGFVRQSGGQVRATSRPGEGTAMALHLPRLVGAPPEEEAGRPTAIPATGRGRHVLVVEDEPAVRMLLAEALEEAGFRATLAEDGPAGLRLLESGAAFDLLVTDVGLPGGLNGRQVADAARARRPGLPVLFVTGYAEGAALGDGHLEPGMGLVTKPFSMADLAARVAGMIGA
ncbi:PAS domain S-box protein [Rubellimicrobium aerolatum]|uniref:histidine kinase n=1 Tax=Rubellimicrobium aerolatum TaxID=490979 RepID=A0ABW0S8P6_9RHOB|nr:PAS domain S-box protein [Rubellimicrobium aerolatum]MBP1804652.1 PAS domain S-box-containing protein [Rubellimicrobium aerolatum]